MGMQRVTTHLDEDDGTVQDVLAKQLDAEVLGLDEDSVATFRTL
jgi:hypothetical protein